MNTLWIAQDKEDNIVIRVELPISTMCKTLCSSKISCLMIVLDFSYAMRLFSMKISAHVLHHTNALAITRKVLAVISCKESWAYEIVRKCGAVCGEVG